MDYRERKYYFVLFDSKARDMRMTYCKICAPSVKFRPMNDRLRRMAFSADFQYPNAFLSCRIEDAECLEYELTKAERRDLCSTWQEITRRDELKFTRSEKK